MIFWNRRILLPRERWLRRGAFLAMATGALCICLGAKASKGAADDTVPVIGLDGNGNSLVQQVPAALFRQGMLAVTSTVQDSLSPVLASQTANAVLAPAWELRNVSVGVTFTGTFGLGPIWSISGIGRLRLVFSDSLNPVYPD